MDRCNVAGDCEASDTCASGHCLPTAPSGKVLSVLNWLATASNEYPDSPAANAIDGLDATGYVSGQAQYAGMWFKIDMLQTQYVFSIQIDCNDGSNDLPAAIDVTFSDTDDWAEAKPVVSNHVVTAHDEFELPQPGIGRYLRITLTQGTNRWWRMDELRLLQ
jgi:hypothetical protein